MSEEDMKTIENSIKLEKEWLENHPMENYNIYIKRSNDLKVKSDPIIQKLYSEGVMPGCPHENIDLNKNDINNNDLQS